MIELGKTQSLTVSAATPNGYLLVCADKDEVLLPTRLVGSASPVVGASIEAFVFLDSSEKRTATAQLPVAQAGQFACLKVTDVNQHGAFLDIGLPKDLLVPHKLQRHDMLKGEWHLVKVQIESDTGRLFGTSKIDKSNDIVTLKDGEIAKIIPFLPTPLGFKVLINNQFFGMAYHNEIFAAVEIGHEYAGTISKIRPDGNIDVLLKVTGSKGHRDDADNILQALQLAGGELMYSTKTNPEDIYARFGMSKKSFKQAIGNLYKRRLIAITDHAIRLL